MNLFQPVQATEWRPEIARGETVGFNSHKNKAPDGAKEKVRRLFFCRPCRGLFRFIVLPTVSPWATFWRASGAFLAAMVLFFAVGAAAETTNTLSDAEIQGRKLAQQLCDARPAADFKNTGVLQIRNSNGNRTNLTFHGQVAVTESNWQSDYYVTRETKSGIPDSITIEIFNPRDQPHEYFFYNVGNCFPKILKSDETMIPFAGSDFWIADFGLEFFHWPAQKVLPKPTNLVRGREYTLLESTNPNPSTNGYSRVLSWIDKETGGPLQAEAYDASGRLLKEFEPKSFKKVNGQWELQEMEIRNVQTGSRTRLEFDLNKQ
jgi:hypothetical protein